MESFGYEKYNPSDGIGKSQVNVHNLNVRPKRICKEHSMFDIFVFHMSQNAVLRL